MVLDDETTNGWYEDSSRDSLSADIILRYPTSGMKRVESGTGKE